MLGFFSGLLDKKSQPPVTKPQTSPDKQLQTSLALSKPQEAPLALSPPNPTYLPASSPPIPTPAIAIAASFKSSYGSTPSIAISPSKSQKASSAINEAEGEGEEDLGEDDSLEEGSPKSVAKAFTPPHLMSDHNVGEPAEDDDNQFLVGSPPGAHPHKYGRSTKRF